MRKSREPISDENLIGSSHNVGFLGATWDDGVWFKWEREGRRPGHQEPVLAGHPLSWSSVQGHVRHTGS